jgi:hypothetical protein
MRERYLFALLGLLTAFLLTRTFVAQPAYTDAFYHFNAANRLVSGQGLTDPYLWTYIGAPDSLPAPSHLYWMPLTSVIAALGMSVLNMPGNYAAAQWPFALMLAATAGAGYWLGGRIGDSRRHAWLAGLLTLFSGFYTRFWGATDTFAPYALLGSLCLVFLGLGACSPPQAQRRVWWFALAGAMAGLGHLTRADGLLLLLVGGAVILWPSRGHFLLPRDRIHALVAISCAYVLVMTPWFIRNLNATGSPLPVGGAQAIWFDEYDDLFNYPPDASPNTLLANGAALSSRWEAFTNNLGTFVAVEGLIVMTPLMLVGLWRRRRDGFLRGFWLYALGLHLAMTLVFPYPGYRGGLFHSASALVPWWSALGVVGLDDAVDWAARRRRHWNAHVAKAIFSIALVAIAVFLSLSTALRNGVPIGTPDLYRTLAAQLPANARVMINDPAQLYYFTGLGGVVLPNEFPDTILDIARKYGVDYLLLEGITDDGRAAQAPQELWSILTSPPDFLTHLPLDVPGARLYEIHR